MYKNLACHKFFLWVEIVVNNFFGRAYKEIN